jgi:septum site-determining protein MinD
MSDTTRTAALVGACGGAGATRLAVETAATLAREGRTVAVLDVAFATQGLSEYVPGEIDPDATAVLADDAPLAEALVELPLDAPGRVALCPARAPFEQLARAQTAGAAGRLADVLADAAARFDHVLVDAPPVATNQAVAAVTAAETVGLVAPASDRGANAVARVRGRLADVGAGADLVAANRSAGGDLDGRADVVVPESEATGVAGAPAAPDGGQFGAAVATLAERLFGLSLERDDEAAGLLSGIR